MVVGNVHRILVAEDDPDLTRALSRFLKKRGFEPTATDSVEKILCLVEQAKVDAVILDLGLGKQNGWDILRRLREISRIPVLLITGSAVDEETRKDVEALGAQGMLAKPFSYDELVDLLQYY